MRLKVFGICLNSPSHMLFKRLIVIELRQYGAGIFSHAMTVPLAFIWRVFLVYIDIDLGYPLLNPTHKASIELPEIHRKCRLESFLVRFNLIVLQNEFPQPFEAVLASDVVDYEVGLKVGEVQIGAVLRAAKALVEIRERQQFFLLEGAHQIQTLTTSPVRPTFALLPYRNTL